jgi:hypothetical protein
MTACTEPRRADADDGRAGEVPAGMTGEAQP